MTLLIVDDEIIAIEGIQEIVDKADFIDTYYTASSMSEAIEKYEKYQIDLLLTDIEMSGGSGLDLIEYLCDHQIKSKNIILSSYPDFKYAQKAIALGVSEYLLKPVTEEDLLKALKKAAISTKLDPSLPPRIKESAFVAAVKQFISDNISSDIGRKEVAAHMGFSGDYVTRQFKQETGYTLSEYIKNERITLAKNLLLQTNLPVSTIAENTGYYSVAYFSATFRQTVGVTPREYRNTHKNML